MSQPHPTLKRTKTMNRTVSANQRRMMSVLSHQNLLSLKNPADHSSGLEKKMSTVNLMFLEDVLEDIESNAKKMQHDINKNLHSLKSSQHNASFSNTNDEESDESVDEEHVTSGERSSAFIRNSTSDQKLSAINESQVSDSKDTPTLAERRNVPERKLTRVLSEDELNWQPKNSPYKSQSFMVKKKRTAYNKAVRLALLESGPFRQLMKEGIKVIVHFLRKGETRVSRVQRIMIWLEDDEVEEEGNDCNVQGRGIYDDDSSDSEEDDIFDKEEKLNLFGFFKLDQNGILESSTSLSDINAVKTVYMGANTSVFKRSLTHLHGEEKSYDRSEHANRCFSLIGCKSPFDDRQCLDIEILPRDKQKPEEIHAACMIAYGVATSFQVLSNLSNDSMMVPEEGEEESTDNDDEDFKELFDNGKLASRKLSVNYLMEEVMQNIPNPPSTLIGSQQSY